MSTQQATLTGEYLDLGESNDVTCPLCGDTVPSKGAVPDHIASDDCDTEHKEIRYD